MTRVAIVLNGDAPGGRLLAELRSHEYIIAADGGANVLMEAGIHPSVVLGDMDSLNPDTKTALEAAGVPLVISPTDKAMTDGELAIERAWAAAPDQVTLFGAFGGRTSMTLTHLQALAEAAKRGLDMQARAAYETVHAVAAPGHRLLDGSEGPVFNVLAWQEGARVSVRGDVAYGVDYLHLQSCAGHGMSNRVGTAGGTIEVHEGVVLIFLEATQ